MIAAGTHILQLLALPATDTQVRAWAQEHQLGNPAAGIFVWVSHDAEE